MMTDAELDAIRARAEAATPGPWGITADSKPNDFDIAGPEPGDTRGMFWREEDAGFVAHARTDVPALLDEVKRLRALLKAPMTDAERAARGRA